MGAVDHSVVSMFESERLEEWGDISEKFVFVDEHLVYVDSPLEGYLRDKRTGEIFAFRCTEIVPERVWHWVLLPAVSAGLMVEAVFSAARATPPHEWISVIEDRRGPKARLSAALLSGERTLPRGV